MTSQTDVQIGPVLDSMNGDETQHPWCYLNPRGSAGSEIYLGVVWQMLNVRFLVTNLGRAVCLPPVARHSAVLDS